MSKRTYGPPDVKLPIDITTWMPTPTLRHKIEVLIILSYATLQSGTHYSFVTKTGRVVVPTSSGCEDALTPVII